MTKAQTYWRSLAELEETPEFREFLHREFPVAASEFPAGISRRRWLQLMGASLALGGVSGCRWQTEKIAPLAVRPEKRVPGEPQYYATSVELAGAPQHLLVTCLDGRPIKVEGNPEHPGQPRCDRSFRPGEPAGAVRSRPQRLAARTSRRPVLSADVGGIRARLRGTTSLKQQGEQFAVLIEPTSSLALHAQLRKLRERFPKAQSLRIHAGFRRAAVASSPAVLWAPAAIAVSLAGSEDHRGVRCRLAGSSSGCRPVGP